MLEPQNSLIPLASLPPFKLLQFNSVAQSCRTLRDPMDCSMPGLPVHQQCLEFTQTHLHWFIDAIQPAHPPSSPSPPAFNLFKHQALFKWLSSSHQVAKVFEFQLQHQSFQWTLKHLVPSLHGNWMGKQWKQWLTLFCGAPKSLQMVIAAMKLKDAYSLEGKLWPT